MNKKLIAVAVAAAMTLPAMANAGAKNKFYGQVHISINHANEDAGWSIDGSPPKANMIGAKGSVDTNLADFKGVYKFEIGINPNLNAADGKGNGPAYQRDTWVGLSSKKIGTVRMGTMATPWKQTGKMVDPFFLTSGEARSFIGAADNTQGKGFGHNRGRANQSFRYDTPSFGGLKVIGMVSINGAGKDTHNAGVHYKKGPIAAFFDFTNYASAEKKTMKVGGKYKMGPASIALSFTKNDDAILKTDRSAAIAAAGGEADPGNMIFGAATYTMGASTLALSIGKNDQNLGYTVGVKQKLAKTMLAYLAYAGSSDDKKSGLSTGAATFGMIKKF